MKIQKQIKEYYKLEKEILNELDTLPSSADECSCALDEREGFSYIFEGEWKEIQTRCTKCGGFIDTRE